MAKKFGYKDLHQARKQEGYTCVQWLREMATQPAIPPRQRKLLLRLAKQLSSYYDSE